MTYLRCIEDSVNICAWVMLSENKDEFMATFGDFFGAIDFNGQKLVGDGALPKKWYQAYRKVHQDFYEFIKGQFPQILKWNGSSDGAEKVYQDKLKALGTVAPSQAPAPVAEKKEEVKAAPAKAAPAKAPAKKTP